MMVGKIFDDVSRSILMRERIQEAMRFRRMRGQPRSALMKGAGSRAGRTYATNGKRECARRVRQIEREQITAHLDWPAPAVEKVSYEPWMPPALSDEVGAVPVRRCLHMMTKPEMRQCKRAATRGTSTCSTHAPKPT